MLFYLYCGSLNYFFFVYKQKTAYEMRIIDWISDVCSSDLVTVEIAAQPLVEALTAHSPIDGSQESRALVVGDRAHPFVGIPIGEIEMEPGRRRIDARLPDRGFQLLPAELD